MDYREYRLRGDSVPDPLRARLTRRTAEPQRARWIGRKRPLRAQSRHVLLEERANEDDPAVVEHAHLVVADREVAQVHGEYALHPAERDRSQGPEVEGNVEDGAVRQVDVRHLDR